MNISVTDQITEHFRLTAIQKTALKKLGLVTIYNLLHHFPVRYGNIAKTQNIESLSKGDVVVIFGKITNLKASRGFRSKIPMASGTVEDETGTIHCVWFNQPYLAKMTPNDASVRIEGKVSERRKTGELYFSNPKIEVVDKLPSVALDSLFNDQISDGGLDRHTLYPIYPESRGITSLWIYHAIQKVFKSGVLDDLTEILPPDIINKYNLPVVKTALIWIHTPIKNDDAISARKRFSFEEIFLIQLGRQQARAQYEKNPTFSIDVNEKHVQEFVKRFPFQATEAQKRAINTILEDMRGDRPMSRLLEGDVGSGKTAVAATTAYAVITSRPQVSKIDEKDGTTRLVKQDFGNLQVAYMCPTEILATQHFESFIQYFSYMPIRIGLITGSSCKVFPSKVNPKGWTDISRTQLLKWVAEDTIAVLIGTHAIIQKSVIFKHLAYAIIDEQHRFGMKQRAELVKKNMAQAVSEKVDEKDTSQVAKATENSRRPAPHLLSMTATPIPRTLTLTIYGDLDLTLLDELPVGRKPIITESVEPDRRAETYEKIRLELRAGRQAFVICPRIDEPDPEKESALNAKSVKEEAKHLKKSIFPEYEIGIMHSKMTASEKDRIMDDFEKGKITILCSTSVVEVGVNVPNATVIVIEGAERFGLAQLHQLRGRVMRSSHQAYCYVFTSTNSDRSRVRLQALITAKNGFELAELDLAQRGAGELSGVRQWGISDVTMEALKNMKMVEAAREEAIRLITEDPSLSGLDMLANAVSDKEKATHFE